MANLAKLTSLDDQDLTAVLDQLQRENSLEGVGFTTDEIARMLDPLAGAQDLDTSPQLAGLEFRVVVDCADEADQARLIEALTSQGRTCRSLYG